MALTVVIAGVGAGASTRPDFRERGHDGVGEPSKAADAGMREFNAVATPVNQSTHETESSSTQMLQTASQLSGLATNLMLLAAPPASTFDSRLRSWARTSEQQHRENSSYSVRPSTPAATPAQRSRPHYA